MKNKLAYFYVLLFLAFSCTNKERLTELEIYTFLEICYEDYYFNYDLEITPLLEDFEQQLIKEGHLKDSTGIAYKELLKKLESETFFSLPLNKEGFNEVALYKNPSQIIDCAYNTFSIDSALVLNTRFSQVSRRINQKIEEDEEISIHYFFNTYRNQLSPKEIKMPYIKQTILLTLYRWYYKSAIEHELKSSSK